MELFDSKTRLRILTKNMVLVDFGFDLTLIFNAEFTKLNQRLELISGAVKYDFFVYEKTFGITKCKLLIFDGLLHTTLKKSFKADLSFKEILKLSRLPLKSTVNFNIKNLAFSGSGLEFVYFLENQFNLNIFVTNSELIFYQKKEELNLINLKLNLMDENEIRLNLEVRTHSTVNEKNLKKIIHKASEDRSVLVLTEELDWVNLYFKN